VEVPTQVSYAYATTTDQRLIHGPDAAICVPRWRRATRSGLPPTRSPEASITAGEHASERLRSVFEGRTPLRRAIDHDDEDCVVACLAVRAFPRWSWLVQLPSQTPTAEVRHKVYRPSLASRNATASAKALKNAKMVANVGYSSRTAAIAVNRLPTPVKINAPPRFSSIGCRPCDCVRKERYQTCE
jgi:hypothetical protein